MVINAPVAVSTVEITTHTFEIYGTQQRAVEYHRGSVNGDDFISASDIDQAKSLITANRWLARQNWKSGFPVPSDGLVPLGIEFAQYELALVLLEQPEAFNRASTGSNERVLRAGPVSIEFFSRTDGANSAFQGLGQLPTQALDLVKPYLASRSVIVTPVVGGLSNQSNALGIDEFGLNEPL